MKKVFFLLLIALLSNWATAQITDYSIFDKKFNFYIANDLGRNGYYCLLYTSPSPRDLG